MLPSLFNGDTGCLDFRRRTMDSVICWMLSIIFLSIGQVKTQACPPSTDIEKLTFQAVETQNMSIQGQDWGSLTPLFRMNRLFLDAVQPHPFPEDLLRMAIRDPRSLQSSEVVKYEAGYVTCAVIAVLFIVFMLVLGIIYCTYQCRGQGVFRSCDGGFCQSTPIFLSLLVTCLILFAGLVCAFYLNEKVHHEVNNGTQDVRQSLEDFRSSVNSIPQALGQVVSEFSIPKLKVFDELQKFGTALEQLVISKLNDEIYPLLRNALQTARQLERATEIIVDVNRTMMNLLQTQDELVAAIRSHKENLERTFSDPNCENCQQAAEMLNELDIGLNYSQSQSVSAFVNRLSNVRKINLTGIFQQGLQNLNEVPKYVKTQITKSANDIRYSLQRTEQEIKSYAARISIQQYTEPINKALLNFEDKSVFYGQEVKQYEYYRWVIGIVLCCVLLVIVVLTLLGLLLGVLGLYLKQDLSDDTARRRVGSVLLTVEVYLTFSTSWLLIIFVFTIFLVGGNMETGMCKYWANGDVYKFLDNPGNLPPNVNLKAQLGLKESSNFSDMYQQCKDWAPIWDVIQFDQPIDLDKYFNISQYTDDLQNKINNFTVDFEALDLFSNIAVLVLSDYKNSRLNLVPQSSILAQIQQPLLTVDSSQFLSGLEALAAMQSDPTIQSEMQNEAASFRTLQDSTLQKQASDTKKLNDSLTALASLTPTLETGIDRAIQDVRTLQGPLLKGTIELLKDESRCLLNRAIGYFTQYVEWVKKMILENIASCRSLPLTLDRLRVIVCHNVTSPWNGFWFCLGWCTFFLIPNIIFSIKSSEHINPLGPRSRRFHPEEENLFPMTEIPPY
ncbi:prominin-2 [Pelodytes ibericus]